MCYNESHTATHCNTLQHTATYCNTEMNNTDRYGRDACCTESHSLQHTATHCNTLQHTAIHHDTLQQRGGTTRVSTLVECVNAFSLSLSLFFFPLSLSLYIFVSLSLSLSFLSLSLSFYIFVTRWLNIPNGREAPSWTNGQHQLNIILFSSPAPNMGHTSTYDMMQLYMWHDVFMCVTWRIHLCTMTHADV